MYKDSTSYQPTPFYVLKKMIDYLNLSHDDVFIDLGCGKGRVVFFVATKRLKKVVGVELCKELAAIAKANLAKLRVNATPIEIIHAECATFSTKEGTVFFMFNPFGEKTLQKVIDNIKDSLVTNPRRIRIVYYNPPYINLLNSQNWLFSEGEIDKTGMFVWHTYFSSCLWGAV